MKQHPKKHNIYHSRQFLCFITNVKRKFRGSSYERNIVLVLEASLNFIRIRNELHFIKY